MSATHDEKPELLRIYLIRHGETEWSLSGQHTGQTDIPLTARGEERARQLGKTLLNISFTHVFTSPLERARRTAELAGFNPAIEPALMEWNYGDYEGKRSKDIYEERPNWVLFRDGSPSGETPEQVSDRADQLITRLRTLSGNVALFSHGHFCSVLAVRWIGLPIVTGQHFPLGTAAVSIIGYEHNHPEVPVISRWNTVSDL